MQAKKTKRKKKKTYSTECEAALAKLLTFIWANFSPGLQRGSTIPLVHKKPDNSFPAQGRSPELADFCYFVLFFKNAQWRYCWEPTRTEGQLMRRQQRRLTVCLHRSLPAACWPRERASGESAAGPEPPSPDRCCKLDELVPKKSEEEEKIKFARYFVCPSMYFFSYYIPLRSM